MTPKLTEEIVDYLLNINKGLCNRMQLRVGCMGSDRRPSTFHTLPIQTQILLHLVGKSQSLFIEFYSSCFVHPEPIVLLHKLPTNHLTYILYKPPQDAIEPHPECKTLSILGDEHTLCLHTYNRRSTYNHMVKEDKCTNIIMYVYMKYHQDMCWARYMR